VARSPVTFTKDIAPVIFDNCGTCHRPGGDGPFSLLTYAAAAEHATDVVAETGEHHMPPWLPAPGEFPILGERRLKQDQIDLFARWVDGGLIEGTAADLPRAPTWPEGWQLGTPDAVLTVARPYTLRPGTEDVYRNLVLRSPLKKNVFVRAVEFKTNGAPIHHAVIRVDASSASRRRDGEGGQPGFDGMASQTVQDPEGHFIGWAPGRGSIVSPDGMPWPLDQGADLVVELHMLPAAKAATIQPAIALYFTDTPPVEFPLSVRMGSRLIDIPAGDREFVLTDTFDLPVPVALLSLYPHAHYLAKDMTVTATLPDGSVKSLLHIPHWDFHWQQDYRFASRIPLPRGTKLTMRYTYDNSDGNKANPHHPPVRVRLGPKSSDEMGELALQVVPASLADAATLIQAFEDRNALEDVKISEGRVRESPTNADYQAALGATLIEAGRTGDAIAPLEAALRIDDRLPGAHSDLGGLLVAQGRADEGLQHLRRAVALAPRDENIAFNLGNALNQLGRAQDASASYERALAINPDFPDAHVNLGSLLMAHGRVADALAHFQRAAELKPRSAVILTNLSSALAASGRLPDAMNRVRQALALRPDYGPALDNLRRLQQMGVR
jgi:Flp pilus assembly protein TadD